MNSNKRFLSPLRLAIASAALMAASQGAMAVPVNKVIEMTCPFPVIGDQIILANISADYPEKILLNEAPVLGPIQIDVITTVPDRARQGLAFAEATQVSGTATSINTFHTAAGDIDNTTDLIISPTDIPTDESGPFDVPASGTTDSVTFDTSHVGIVSLTVDDLILNMKNYKANGQLANQPIGQFEADCSVNEGQDTTLTTFEVVGDIVVVHPADIDVTPNFLEFGTLQLSQSLTKTVTISNVGDLDLGINSILITGTDNASFTEVNGCTTLSKDASCTVDVTYTASEENTKTATLEISSTDQKEPLVSVPLTGTGQLELIPVIGVDLNNVDFGSIDDGASSTKTITISNTGGAALTISSAAVSGDNFVKSSDNCSIVTPGSSCAIDVKFDAILGKSNGSLTIESDDAQQPSLLIPLTGEGQDGGFVIDILLGIQGTSKIAANGGTLPLNGSILSHINVSSGAITGDMELDPTSGKFEVIKGWSRYLATAQIEFEAVGETVGSLVDGKLIAVAKAYIKVPKVTKTLFGLIDWQIGGGDDCRTESPVTFTIESPEGQPFDKFEGGLVVGTYDLPPLENCGLLTSILNLKMAGPGNTINLKMSPIFD